MIKFSLLELMTPGAAHDRHIGGSYGSISPKFHTNRQQGSVWPYRSDLEYDEECDWEDIDPETYDAVRSKHFDQHFASDPNGQRQDRRSLTTGHLNEEMPFIKGDSLHGTMSPIPKSHLYPKKNRGSAIGGTASTFAHRTGPPRRHGTLRGWSKSPSDVGSDSRYTLSDIMNSPEIRPFERVQQMIRRVLDQQHIETEEEYDSYHGEE